MVECELLEPKAGKRMTTQFFVATTHKKPVLGLQACIDFRLIAVQSEHLHNLFTQNDSDYKPLTRDDVIRKYSDLFVGYGKFEGKVHLETDPNIEPVKVVPRRIPLHIRDKVGKELKSLCDNDIIEPTDCNLPWSSHLQPVLKSNGEVRICMSPLALNEALKSVECILPTLDDVLPELSKARVFSVLDTRHAFFHCELDDSTKALMCMETGIWGKFVWKRLPQGIKVASQVYAHKMRESLQTLKSVKAIADDINCMGLW